MSSNRSQEWACKWATWSLFVLLLVPAADAASDPGFLQSRKVLADYNNEIRRSDGLLDVDEMIARLTQLQVDTYFYLIWHRSTDWEDLKRFLPAAEEAGIAVWPYLVPPSESPPFHTWYSEPFRLDYIRWGEEIARLSLTHSNLEAFVIDDFYANRAFYTPEYVRQMRDRARSVNPEMKFLPLMYYHEMDAEFVTAYRAVVDGVVAAYPRSGAAVQSAWKLLNDRIDQPERMRIGYPWNLPSVAGNWASMTQIVSVADAGPFQITFNERDDYTGPTSGYHIKELLVDDAVVWESDVANGDREWRRVSVDVTAWVRGRETVEVKFRINERRAVSNFGVDFEIEGVTYEGLSAETEDWTISSSSPWIVDRKPGYIGTGKFRIPLIVMIASNRSQFVKRNGEPATAERIRDKVQMAVTQMRSGFAEGVVTYALLKRIDDDIYGAIWQLFLRTRRSETADFDRSGSVNFDDFLLFARAFGSRVGAYDGTQAAYDLDVDGEVGFSDFVLFALAYGES